MDSQKAIQMNPMVQPSIPALRTPVKHEEGSPTGKMGYHPNKSPQSAQTDPMAP